MMTARALVTEHYLGGLLKGLTEVAVTRRPRSHHDLHADALLLNLGLKHAAGRQVRHLVLHMKDVTFF